MSLKYCTPYGLIVLVLLVADLQVCFSASAIIQKDENRGQTAPRKTLPQDPGAWKREPFKSLDGQNKPNGTLGSPAIQPGAPQQDFALQGIMKSGVRYYAIVNGRTVKRGDRIDGWTVADISRFQVQFKRDKEKLVYDIYQGKMDRGNR